MDPEKAVREQPDFYDHAPLYDGFGPPEHKEARGAGAFLTVLGVALVIGLFYALSLMGKF